MTEKCKCPKPLVGERPGSHARCRLCDGYITADYVISLQEKIGRLADLMKMVQWDGHYIADYEEVINVCPWCNEYQKHGHAQSCPLVAVLDDVVVQESQ